MFLKYLKYTVHYCILVRLGECFSKCANRIRSMLLHDLSFIIMNRWKRSLVHYSLLIFEEMCVDPDDLDNFRERDKAFSAAAKLAQLNAGKAQRKLAEQNRRAAREDYNRKVAEVA